MQRSNAETKKKGKDPTSPDPTLPTSHWRLIAAVLCPTLPRPPNDAKIQGEGTGHSVGLSQS